MTRRYYGMDVPISTGPHPDPFGSAEPGTEEAQHAGCTCTVTRDWHDGDEIVRRDEWCPLHGRDPDYERQKRQDEERER